MKKAFKWGLFIGTPALTMILLYFLTPIRAWKKYQKEHPALFEEGCEKTTYLQFCSSYWKAFTKTAEGKDDEITYTAGQLPDIDVVASKPNE